MSNQSVEQVVYLEDIDKPSARSAKSAGDPDANPSSQTSVGCTDDKLASGSGAVNGKAATTNGLKRQRTLVDMFPAAPSGQGSKKLKLENNGGSSGSIKAFATTAASGSQSLNSIPFSLSSYQESLAEQERQLLGLECETLGKSW